MTPPEISIRASSKRNAEEYETDIKTLVVEKRRIKRVQNKLSVYLDTRKWFEHQQELLWTEGDEEEMRYEQALCRLRGEGLHDDSPEIVALRTKHYSARDENYRQQQETDKTLHDLAMQAYKGKQKLTEEGYESGNAFVELLMIAYQQKGQGPRTSSEQSQLRNDSIEMYGSREPGSDRLWCPITHAFLPPDEVCAAHIFPHKLGTNTMHLIFGANDANEIMSPKNCIIISKAIEKRFDKHSLAIVPIETPSGSPSKWKVRVLNASQGEKTVQGTNLSMNDLDNRELDFRTPYRPAARYLYYHFVMSLLFAQKGQEKGWITRITSQEHKFWAAPGKYLRKSMLRQVAQHIGHQIDAKIEDEDIDAIPNTFDEPTEPSSEIQASQKVGLRHMKKFVGLKARREGDDD